MLTTHQYRFVTCFALVALAVMCVAVLYSARAAQASDDSRVAPQETAQQQQG